MVCLGVCVHTHMCVHTWYSSCLVTLTFLDLRFNVSHYNIYENVLTIIITNSSFPHSLFLFWGETPFTCLLGMLTLYHNSWMQFCFIHTVSMCSSFCSYY